MANISMSTTTSSSVVEQPTRQELVQAFQRRSLTLTFEQADAIFDDWLPCPDPYRDQSGRWALRLKEPRRRH